MSRLVHHGDSGRRPNQARNRHGDSEVVGESLVIDRLAHSTQLGLGSLRRADPDGVSDQRSDRCNRQYHRDSGSKSSATLRTAGRPPTEQEESRQARCIGLQASQASPASRLEQRHGQVQDAWAGSRCMGRLGCLRRWARPWRPPHRAPSGAAIGRSGRWRESPALGRMRGGAVVRGGAHPNPRTRPHAWT
jgi:hypothetical protein